METLEMQVCRFWLASGKKCQITLWDSSVIGIQVIAFESEVKSPSVMSDSLWPHRLYDPWNSAGKNTGVGSLSLLQGILQTQQSNPGLPHCRQILYWQSRKGGPRILDWVACPFCSGSGFLIQKSNCALLQCKRILHQLRYEGSPISLKTSF